MYLNLIQIAESFGVSEQVVTEWVKNEGMPHVHDRDRILFEQSLVMDWAARKGLATHGGFLSQPVQSQTPDPDLAPLLRRGGIWRGVRTAELPDLLERILQRLPGLTPPMHEMLSKRLGEPGGLVVSPVGRGFALPHPSMCVFLGHSNSLVAFIQLDDPLGGVEPPDAVPVTRLLFFISPTPRQHVNMLGLLARCVALGDLGRAMDAGEDDEALLRAVAAGCVRAGSTTGGGSR